MQNTLSFIKRVSFLLFFQTTLLSAVQTNTALEDKFLDRVNQCLDFSGLKDSERRREISLLLLKTREQEQNFPEAHSFFTAQDSSFFAYQVIAKELYENLEAKEWPDFEFLRYPGAALIKSRQEFFEKVPELYFNSQEARIHTYLLEKAKKMAYLREELADIEWEAMISEFIEDQERFKKKKAELEAQLDMIEKERQQLLNQFKSTIEEEIEELERTKPTPTRLKRLDVLYKRLKQLSFNNDEEDENSSDKLISDVLPDISRQLISVSYSMENYTPLDSAFFVFMTGRGVSASSIAVDEKDYSKRFEYCVRELFETTGISAAVYEPYLDELIQTAPRTKEGILNQIFIPKKRIREFFYPSFGGGFFSSLEDENLSEILSSFKEGRFHSDFDVTTNKQGRLIAGSLFDEEVKIFRYTLIPKAEQEAYQARVKEIIQAILFKFTRL